MLVATETKTGHDPISRKQTRGPLMAELSMTLLLLTTAQIRSLLEQANRYARESVQR